MRIRAWTLRNSNGLLVNPRCVLAHLKEINDYNPNLITQSDLDYIRSLRK